MRKWNWIVGVARAAVAGGFLMALGATPAAAALKSTTTVLSATPATVGASVTLTATVNSSPTPGGGSVEFYIDTLLYATVPVNSGVATTTKTWTNVTGSAHPVSAKYLGFNIGGSGNSWDISTSTTISSVAVNQATPTVTRTSTLTPSALGATVSYTVTVAGAGDPPTGTVQIKEGTAVVGSGTLTPGNPSTVNINVTFTTAGSHTPLTAAYLGNANYLTANSAAFSQTVNKGTPTVGLNSTPNPLNTLGGSVQYTATVSFAGSPTATGTVQFKDNGSPIGAAVSLVGGVATKSVSYNTAGSHSITADYIPAGSDTNYLASATASPLIQGVSKETPTVGMVRDLSSPGVGIVVTFDVTVAGGGGGPSPTGNVQLVLDGNPFGTAKPLAGGTAQFKLPLLIAGTHNVVASYVGDTNYLPATSPTVTETVVGNPATAGQLIISEFRESGAGGATDEFVTLYNTTAGPLTVATSDGSSGYALATSASGGTIVEVVPNGTVIPAKGHYLFAHATGYTLSAYPGGGADKPYSTDIPENTSLALFNTATVGNFTSGPSGTRLDAVGFGTEGDGRFFEGTTLPVVTPTLAGTEYSLMRNTPAGWPKDVDDNSQDFVLISTAAVPPTITGYTTTLGAPHPQNKASMLRNDQIVGTLLDAGQPQNAEPNFHRVTSPAVPNGSLGTLALRRTFTNNTGGSVSALRFRVVEITTASTPIAAAADLRMLDSTQITVSSITVNGITLDATPLQAAGGGLGSTLALGTPLANGGAVSVDFLMGVNRGGYWKLYVVVEAIP